MTQAPERIWFTKVGQNIVPNSSRVTDEDTEYLRADLAPDHAAFDQMREALLDATAHLAGAASAYKTFAKRHRKFGVAETDALYGTRLKDFNAAIDRARAALKAAEGE